MYSTDSRMPAPESRYSNRTLLLHLWRAVRRYPLHLWGGLAALIVTNLMATSIPWQIRGIIDRLEGVTRLEPLWWQLAGLLGLAGVMWGIRILSRQGCLGMGRLVEHDLRNALFSHLLKMPPDYFAVNATGELMSRMTNDITALRYLTGGGLLLGSNTILVYATTLPMMFRISPRLTLFSLILYPLAVWAMSRVSARVRTSFLEVQSVIGRISGVAQENFSTMSVLQSYAKERSEARRMARLSESYTAANRLLISRRTWLQLIMSLVTGLCVLAALLEGGREIMAGEMTRGGFLAFALYLERLAWPTLALGWTITMFQQGLGAMSRVQTVLDSPSATPGPSQSELLPLPERLQRGEAPGLRLSHLTFRYRNPYAEPGSNDDTEPRAILKDISLTIPAGSLVALVGRVGSGKSTLLRLLSRLHEPPAGTLFLDGADITRLPLAELRRWMGVVTQHAVVFSESASANIAFGNPEAEVERVRLSAAMASLHEELVGLPEGYATQLGEKGLSLSGGQRQRLTLARSLLVNAPLLLLDDPFSNVDPDTEQSIIGALNRHRRERAQTILFASHRFAWVRQADWVVMLDDGRIAEVGTHDALLARSDAYRALVAEAEVSGEEGFQATESPGFAESVSPSEALADR